MNDPELQALKADFLDWTGGFEPETEAEIAAYVGTSMPFQLNPNDARTSLLEWMRDAVSLQVGLDLDQH